MGAPQSKESKASGKQRGKTSVKESKQVPVLNIFTEHNGKSSSYVNVLYDLNMHSQYTMFLSLKFIRNVNSKSKDLKWLATNCIWYRSRRALCIKPFSQMFRKHEKWLSDFQIFFRRPLSANDFPHKIPFASKVAKYFKFIFAFSVINSHFANGWNG